MTKKKISSILTIVLLSVFLWYFVENIDSFKTLSTIPLAALVFISVAKLLRYISNGLFIQWTVEVFTKKFSLKESVYVATLSAVANFFGPLLGGTTVRAVYLKKVHKLSYSFFTSTLAGYYVILFGIGSLIGVVSLLFLDNSAHGNGLLVFFSVWFVSMVALMFARLPKRSRFEWTKKNKITATIIEIVYDIERGWAKITKTDKLLTKLTLLGASGFVITFFTSMVEFNAIGVSISPAALGLYTAISATAILISFTPGAIGIKEGLLIVNSSALGLSTEQILQVAVIDRGITFLLLGVLYFVTKRMKKNMTQLESGQQGGANSA